MRPSGSPAAAPLGAARLRAWVVWSVAVVGYVLAVTSRSALAVTGIVAAERFEITASTLSTFAVVQVVVYGAVQIPVGVLLDRWGSRAIMAVGVILMATGHVLTAVAGDAGAVVLARAIVGLGDATMFVSILRLIPAWFPPAVAPVLVQVSGMIGMLGQLVSVFPFASAVVTAGWTTAFLGLAGVALVVSAAVAAVVRDAPTGVATARATSVRDALVGARNAWRSPATRLGFWAHFSTPFASTVFSLLWGYPFLTAGEGLSGEAASVVMVALVGANLVAGPIVGALVGARPAWRTRLVVGIVAVQAGALASVVLWPGRAPFALLVAFACVVAVGGPASMVAFDFVRTGNPLAQLGSANGIVNVGGFLSAALVLGGVGLLLDAQGAGSPPDYTLAAFRIAMLVHVPVWVLGIVMVVRLGHILRRSSASPDRSSPVFTPDRPPRSAS